MPTSAITNTTKDLQGNVVANVTVVITLQPPGGFRISDGSEVAPQVTLTSNGSGNWSAGLEQTSNISPSGSFYVVQEQYAAAQGGYREYAFTVGSVTATLFASLLAATPPSPVTNYLTQAQGDARYLPISSVLQGPFVDAYNYGARADSGTTDNGAAITTAIAALGATGGTVFLRPASGRYDCSTPIVAKETVNVGLLGSGGPTGGAQGAQWLRYTGSGARFIDARSSAGFKVVGLYITQSASAAVNLIDLAHDPAGTGCGGGPCDSGQFLIEDNFLGGVTTAGVTLINLDKAIDGKITRNVFNGAADGIGGNATYSNRHLVEDNTFEAQTNAPITNPFQAWTVNSNTFEGLNTGAAGAVLASSPCTSLTFTGNWLGDVNATGIWLDFAGADGLVCTGNFFNQGSTAVYFAAATQFHNPTISGNVFSTCVHAVSIFAGATVNDLIALGNFYYNTSGTILDNSGTIASGFYNFNAGASTTGITATPGFTTPIINLVSSSNAPRLYGGVGGPVGGVTGDFYLRYDGGGAGATHVYFNNGGVWIGVA